MTTPAQIRISELDFDQILTNLVEFMKADPTFSDYDFTGSNLRLIARTLAYVTFYNNYYLSAAVNESFLDTAQLRSSVVSHARMLGYRTHGTVSATYDANVVLVMSNTAPQTITLPRNTKFELQSNTSYVFYTVDDSTLEQNSTSLYYEASDVMLVEGRPATYQFVVDVNDPTQRFIIPNANVDFAHIRVYVQDSVSSNTRTLYTEATNLVTISNTDPIFLVHEAYSGYPELKFGNDIVGKKLEHGNVIIAEYYVSRGDGGNGIRGPFRINDTNISGLTRGVTATPDANTVVSHGGAGAEDLDQIRYLAPLAYTAQNRCVTAEDYKTMILASYGDSISAINVFGGEEGNPEDVLERPSYGHVYIVLKPTVGLRFTETARNTIVTSIIKPHSVIGVIPEVIDPDYIYTVISTQVLYNPKATTRTKQELATAVQNSISTFATNNLEKFNTAFRFSKLARAIDDTDVAISSSLTRIELQKRIYPTPDRSNSFTIKFGTPLYQNGTDSVILRASSHRFSYRDHTGTLYTNCYLTEANGVVSVTGLSQDGPHTPIIVDDGVGTLDADTGVMTLANFAPVTVEDNAVDIWINVLPRRTDLVATSNRLFTLDADNITVSLADDTLTLTATSFYQGGVLR
tara:strand:+ start:3047 stop:4942 length:1896 start_codon:yes stop_codon:yes gene_type:complete